MGSTSGYAILTPMELSEFFPKYHLSYIATHADARGRGVGTVLLEEAIRLYEKFGFERKYYRMLYKGTRTLDVDPTQGSGWPTPALDE